MSRYKLAVPSGRAGTRHRKSRHRRGAILLLVALSMVALMSVLVLALDGGIVQREKRIAQMAADAAAQAGALEIYRTRSDLAVASATGEATRNGFVHGAGGKEVIVTWPSTTGAYTGNNFVSVLIKDTVRTVFGSLLGRPKVVVNARATGGVTGTTSACVQTLDPDDKDALEVQSGAYVNATGCKVVVNSNHPSEAMSVTGSTLIAGSIDITGGYYAHAATMTPATPATGQVPATDPLIGTTLTVADTSGACAPGTDGAHLYYNYAADATINPGVYCGGIKIAKSTTTVTFNPGLYVIKGGGLTVATDAHVIANGVSIVNLNAPLADGGASKFEPLVITSGSGSVFSAMTTGSLATILFYSPRNQGVAGHVPLNLITSSATTTMTGSLYFPDQQLKVGASNVTLNIVGGIVAADINFASDAIVNISGYSGGAYGLKRGSVVE
jgi:Flp pilus assembly protein TadG